MGNKVENDNRILYVEPNDIFGNIQGNPLTPDYSDFSIYCNLTVEKTNRLKNPYIGTSNNGSYSITANLTNSEQKLEYDSFFQGESKDYPYLTTDYTNIHFNSVKKATIVEGLQITGIDVSYMNWMCPLVTINMVDIRGGGIFGREEAIHVNNSIGVDYLERDEENKIIDNIYSGFMSFPYPRYKLHLKGFLGRAVTYQLTCQSFNGKLDASTGNFNITATFIGYEYGCLQDLPLSYIMAAPLTPSGREYWEKKCSSPEWNLFLKDGFGNEQPIMLHEFMQKIKEGVDKNAESNYHLNDSIIDDSLIKITNEYNSKKSLIEAINTAKDNFIKALKSSNEQCTIKQLTTNIENDENGDEVYMIFSKNSSINITDAVANAYNTFGSLIDEYIKSHEKDGVGYSCIPSNINNSWDEESFWQRSVTTIPEFFRVQNGSLIAVSYESNREKLIPSIDAKYEFDDPKVRINEFNTYNSYSFNSQESTAIYKFITDSENKGKYPYCSVIIFNKANRFKTILSQLETMYKDYQKRMIDGSLVDIKQLTAGITPYIGNYYKMIFCHIDTFIHTLWSCVDDIYAEIKDNNREPSKLGIRTHSQTDVPQDIYYPGVNKGVIPPFPGIYKNYEEENDYGDSSADNVMKTIGWVGDVHGETAWREQKLVDEYYNALRRIESNNNEMSWINTDSIALKFRLLPCLLTDIQNKSLFNTRDGMAFYLSTMIEWIVGIINSSGKVTVDEAKIIGAILAKNLFDDIENKDRLIEFAKGDLSNDLLNICLLKEINGNNDRRRFEFTSSKDHSDRHALFNENGDNVEYVYMLDTNNKPIVPLDSITDWGELQTKYNYYNYTESIPAFTPKNVIDGDYVMMKSAKEFIKPIRNIFDNDYTNSKLFSIWLDSCNVNSMSIKIDEYIDSGDDIGNFKKDNIVKHVVDKYWLTNDNYKEYQNINVDTLSDNKCDIEEILHTTENGEYTVDDDEITRLINLEY